MDKCIYVSIQGVISTLHRGREGQNLRKQTFSNDEACRINTKKAKLQKFI